MKYYNLQYYVDKLKNGEKFSLARYGDGEMLCMWGKKGGNSNGCRYSPELREALLDSMKYKDDSSFIYGMQRVLPRDRERFENEYPDIEFYDTEIFSEAVANGELYPLIEQLKKMDVVVISNIEAIQGFVNATSDKLRFKYIVTPKSNTFDMQEELVKVINGLNDKPRIYLFSIGMAANAIIGELHGKIDGCLVDLGHIWDPFVGLMSRCDLEGKTKEDIEKNLYDR